MQIKSLMAGALAVASLASVRAQAQDVDVEEAPPPESVELDAPPPGDEMPPPEAAPEPQPPVPAQGGDVADVDSFNAPLAPYGEWVDVPGVGNAWRPYPNVVGPDFQPYQTGGHWAYTEVGWTYVSDYPWGWAPFHYGRWWMEAGYGWVWLPGTAWAPAWVSWRYGGPYVGWAPLAPVGFSFGVTMGWGSPWCFIPTQYIATPGWRSYAVPVAEVNVAYGATRVVAVSGGRYSVGPPLVHVQAAVGHPITQYRVAEVAHSLPPASVHVAHPLVAGGHTVTAVRPTQATRIPPSFAPGRSSAQPSRSFAPSHSYAPSHSFESERPVGTSRPSMSYQSSRQSAARPSWGSTRATPTPAKRYPNDSSSPPPPRKSSGGGRRR